MSTLIHPNVLQPATKGNAVAKAVSYNAIFTQMGKYKITPKEHLLLTFLQEGLSYEAIAAKAAISLKTLKAHVYSMYKKLGANNRVQAVNTYFGAVTYAKEAHSAKVQQTIHIPLPKQRSEIRLGDIEISIARSIDKETKEEYFTLTIIQ